jgi:hypothetical protein
MGIGLPVAGVPCYLGIQTAVGELLDTHVKNQLRDVVWGNKNKGAGKVFYKLFGGKYGSSSPSRSNSNSHANCEYNDRSGKAYAVVPGTVLGSISGTPSSNANACTSKCRSNRNCKYFFFANMKRGGGKKCYLLKKRQVYNTRGESDRNSRCSGKR